MLTGIPSKWVFLVKINADIIDLPQVSDYGDMAEVRGAFSVNDDTPSLTLLVMRKSEYAPGGKPTISKDELLKMAETIAVSIKRR